LELFNKKELNQLDFLHDQINTNPSEERVTNKNKKIEKILILDTETTGLDENKDQVIEIGVDSSDFIVAHNVEFDKKWFGKGRLPKLNKKWICSLEDINWSFQKSLKTRPSVTDLALSFSIPVWNLHRALSDCFYISEVFKKCDNLEELLLKATEPRFLYKALVSYEDRSLAKNAGFRWNSPVQGAWSRKLTTDEAKNLDFRVEILN
jgi:DNA polymerase-3 subunit epsilon